MEAGEVKEEHVIEDQTTAEATFDNICERHMGEEYKDVLGNTVDYGCRLMEANLYLKSVGREIVWLEQVTVNRYKNS